MSDATPPFVLPAALPVVSTPTELFARLKADHLLVMLPLPANASASAESAYRLVKGGTEVAVVSGRAARAAIGDRRVAEIRKGPDGELLYGITLKGRGHSSAATTTGDEER